MNPPFLELASGAARQLLACDSLAVLERSAFAVAQDVLGPEPVRDQAFFYLDPNSGAPGHGWLMHEGSLPTGRFYRPRRPLAPVADVLARGSGELWASLPIGALVEPGEPARIQAPRTLLLPLAGSRGQTIGVWMLGMTQPADELDETARRELALAAQVMGMLLPRLLQTDQLARQVHQIAMLHETMATLLLASDRGALMNGLLELLTRDLGFTRVQIALVHPDTHMLRSELHTGFSAAFKPIAVSLDDKQDLFVHCLTNPVADVMLIEAPGGDHSGPISRMAGDPLAERVVLIPLRIGTRPLGIIYADQAIHDGAPCYKPLFEIFARMAALAVDALTQRVRAEHRAETDPLTGLRNRYFLDKILQIEIPRVQRYNTALSLLMIDLVDFKRTNDSYGHQFGDYILRETANLLQACVRRGDVVIRYGGDEFVVLMVNTSHELAQLVRDRIEQAFVDRNRLLRDERTRISISMGLRSATAGDIEGLLHEADMAMYAHKAQQNTLILLRALISGNLERIEASERVVGSLCNILYKKEPYYPDHARRVAHLALRLARLVDLAEPDIPVLALAALLHDVGKVSMPTEVLQKHAPLSQGEIEAMRHHPALGEEFFQGIDYLEPVRPLIRSHHERYDGSMSGEFPAYPDGLSGERIPLGGRILKIAEAVDAMLVSRPYREALPLERVTQILREEAGRSFDPQLVRLLLADKDWHCTLGTPESIMSLLRTVAEPA